MNVALFVTCLTDSFFPRVGEAVVRVLRHFGCSVEFPEAQTCCGQPGYTAGFHPQATQLARRFVQVFDGYECIVTPSASCAGMVRHHLNELLADDPRHADAARRVAARTYEFGEFLTRMLKLNVAELLRGDEPMTFHWPCHARGIYSADDLQNWLVRGAADSPCAAGGAPRMRAPAHADLCCGFGGVFSVDCAEISGAMLRDRLEELSATGARLVVCSEGGCTLQLAGGARRAGLPLRFKHLAELLAESLGLMEPLP